MNLRIVYVLEIDAITVVAFQIGAELFYMKLGAQYPKIYDASLVRQIVVNVDEWLQMKTQQRYSFRGVCDMASAFLGGVNAVFGREEVAAISAAVVRMARACLFTSVLASDYARLYWIEVCESSKLERMLVDGLRDKFDELRISLGDDKLHSYLCRIHAASRMRKSGVAQACDMLVGRLGRSLQEPQYPDTEALDQQLVRDVFQKLWPKGSVSMKGQLDDVLINIKQLSQRGD